MAAPCASASIWKTCIQQPAIVLLESLLAQVQVARQSDPAFAIPTIKVRKDCFQPDQQKHATTMLGINFSTESESLPLTVLQYSVLSLYSGRPEDADQRELVIEMLVRTFPSDEITRSLFEDSNNALHLAAFLNMESTLQLLIAYGGDPRCENGRGLSAFDILFAVKAADLPNFQSQDSSPSSVRNNVTSATLDAVAAASVQRGRVFGTDGQGLASSFQPFVSTAAVEQSTNNQYADEFVYHGEAPERSTAQFECLGDNDSLELGLDDGPQVLQLIHQDVNRSLDSPNSDDSFAYDCSGAFADGYDHDDLGNYSGNNAHLVERDAQDLAPYSYYQDDLAYQYYLREQQELEEYGMADVQLHEDLTCFLRIQPCGPCSTASGEPLVSILKNRQAWRLLELSPKHAESFDAYEAYTDRLQLQRKPDVASTDGHYNRPEHEKWVHWSSIKVVRIYQRHMNYQLETDGWDGPHVSEPFNEPVEDSFVPTASPYDIVRPVTPLRPSSNSFSMNLNNSCLDLSSDAALDRTVFSLPQGASRPLPEIPQPAKDSVRLSIFGHRKGTPPPPSFLSKPPSAIADTLSGVTTQADESTKSSPALSFSKRLSATSLLWSSKLPNSPLAKMSFSHSETQIRSPTLPPSSDAAYSDSALVLDQQVSADLIPPLVTDSSLWVPRMLRNFSSPSNPLSKAKNRNSTDLSRSTLKSPPVEDLLVQEAPFAFSSDIAGHDGYPSDISPEAAFGTEVYAKEYDSMISIDYPRSTSSASTTAATTATSKVFSQIKSAIREKFSTPSRVTSPIPRSRSTPPIFPPIPMSRALSEPPSPTQSANVHDNGLHALLTIESSLDRNNSDSGLDIETSAIGEDVNEDDKAVTTFKQRRLSLSAITGDQLDTIRAHIPRVASPLAQVSYSRSTTRSPQLYSPTDTSSTPDAEDPAAVTTEDDQGGSLSLGPKVDTALLQEYHQSLADPSSRRLSFTGAAKNILEITTSVASASRHATQYIQEDPNRPALSERPPSRSGSSSSSLSLTLSQAQSGGTFLPRRETSATSSARHSNWKKRKEVAMILPSMTSSPPPDPLSPPPDPLSPPLVEQERYHSLPTEELAIEELPVHDADHSVETEVTETLGNNGSLDKKSGPAECSTVAILSPVQQNDSRPKNYQDMLVKSADMTIMAKSLYVLPELTFSVSSLAEMEYVHGVTHATCSAFLDGTQDVNKGSSLRAALVNIQGIGHGLEVQKYKLRQTTVVQRYSDVDHSPSTSSPLAAGSIVIQPSQQERHVSSFWMNISEFDSQLRRSTLSNCDSPSTTLTGVLYLRLKKVCNFSLPLPGENTMISIRIDTGYEKVDTDYVPLEDIDMIFNQEFCLPVCPDLAITITLHLMQAPHLQPRHQQQQLLSIAAYSSPPRAISSNDEFTLERYALDRPSSASSSPYTTKSLPAIPQQQQPHHTPVTAGVFHSIGKKSIISSLFHKRAQPSSLQSFLDVDPSSPTTTAAVEGNSLFGSIGRRSAHALAIASAISRPWVSNAPSSSSSSSSTIQSSGPATPSPASSSPAPMRSAIASRLLQHSPSSSTASSSKSTSTSESSLSTLPSSCDESSDLGGSGMLEKDRQKSSGNSTSTLAKWKRGIFSVGKKHRFGLKQDSQQPTAAHSGTTAATTAGGNSSSNSAATPAIQQQQQLSVDQEQWKSYWKELGDQHQKGSIGSSHGRSLLSRRSPPPRNNVNSSSTANIPSQHNTCTQRSDIEQPALTSTLTTTTNACSTPIPFLPQLTQAQIRATESPLEILTRHILFDDELCVARTGIVFNEIRTACTNQIVNVEFQTVNNWVDLNDYSRIGGQLGRESPSQSAVMAKDQEDNDDANEDDDEGPARDAMVANIQTTVCFIPGPEMDPEDAIFEEHERLPLEPQNLVDCHVGLKYFHWQNQLLFCGELFYREEQVAERPDKWRQGKFCIVGSVLWQLRLRVSREGEDEDEQDERWRCLDLSLVNGIETSLGYFDARARFLVEAEDGDEPQQHLQQQEPQQMSIRVKDVSEEYYPVRNGFRLCMTKAGEAEDEQREVEQRFEVEFYSESTEQGQQWISALMEACRERPPRPYWLN
ncbi:hypothetical protein BGW39_007649 [Mortierella sp. 14UC]|nr:hypothetical protein BGW39_007649 [Mortierella sp. 14UC]